MHLDTAIIIVNWNGWQDTIRCVDASLNMDGFNGAIFICDNASQNSSYEKVVLWANGELVVEPDAKFDDVKQTCHLKQKKLFFAGTPSEVESEILNIGVQSRKIYIIKAPINGGFSYGNNVGIKLALLNSSIDLFWMLNSDALPSKSAYLELKRYSCQKDYPLFAGSTLCEYFDPFVIQNIGTSKPLFPFSLVKTLVGKSANIGKFLADVNLPNKLNVLYPVGASMLINRAYIQNYGLLDEAYFLYYEELDLALRCDAKNVFICTKSIVYHKGGKSTGQSYAEKKINGFADYHGIRSRWILAKKLGMTQILLTFIFVTYSFIKRLMLGDFKVALNVFKASYDGLNHK